MIRSDASSHGVDSDCVRYVLLDILSLSLSLSLSRV